jgi:mannan endo-1,4-beta-mannosidase
MRAFPLLAAVLCSSYCSTTAFAAKSFSATNLYYAAGLKDSQQTFLFDGLKSAGVKVLRVWLDGRSHDTLESAALYANTAYSQGNPATQRAQKLTVFPVSREIPLRTTMILF